MSKRKIFYIVFVVMALILTGASVYYSQFFTPKETQAGFGISPPYVRNLKDLKPGDTYTQKVTVLRTNADSEGRATVTLNASSTLGSWITIKPKVIIIPEGEFQATTEVTVKIPVNAKPGIYRGRLSFLNQPKNYTEGAVNIALGALVKIELTVKAK